MPDFGHSNAARIPSSCMNACVTPGCGELPIVKFKYGLHMHFYRLVYLPSLKDSHEFNYANIYIYINMCVVKYN